MKPLQKQTNQINGTIKPLLPRLHNKLIHQRSSLDDSDGNILVYFRADGDPLRDWNPLFGIVFRSQILGRCYGERTTQRCTHTSKTSVDKQARKGIDQPRND